MDFQLTIHNVNENERKEEVLRRLQHFINKAYNLDTAFPTTDTPYFARSRDEIYETAAFVEFIGAQIKSNTNATHTLLDLYASTAPEPTNKELEEVYKLRRNTSRMHAIAGYRLAFAHAMLRERENYIKANSGE